MNSIQTLILILLTTSLCTSQNYLFVNDRQYPSTPEWSFESGSREISRVQLVVAKNENTGYLSVSINNYLSRNATFKSKLYLFLEDGETLILDKIVSKDQYDDINSVVFEISKENFEVLERLDILEIRYTLSKPTIFGDNYNNSNYTAKNKRPSTELLLNEINSRVYVNETASERRKRQNSSNIIPEFYLTSSDIRAL